MAPRRIWITAAVLIVLLMAVGAQAQIDFMRKHDEAAAEQLYSDGKYAEAQKAFEKLAATADLPAGEAKWTARAAIAFSRQKNKYDEAMKMAESIELEPFSVYAQMRIMLLAEKYDALIKKFKDARIKEWTGYKVAAQHRRPAQDVRTYAWYYRGTAYYETGDGEAAHEDLSKAADRAVGGRVQLDIWRTAASNAARVLEDPEKAYEFNSRVAGLGGGGASFFRGVIGAANYLAGQEKYDEALDVLNRMNPRNQRGWWHGSGLLTLGRILEQAGRTEEAIDAYRQMISEGEPHRNHFGPGVLKLGELLAGQGKKQEAIEVYKKLLEKEDARDGDKEAARKAIMELGGPAE